MEQQPAPQFLERIQRNNTLPDDVYDALLNMLVWGHWEPEQRLSIEGIADMLGVSPTPVREALPRLQSTGLVQRTARRGYRVAPPMSHEQMSELVDARLVLEVGAMERAMAQPDALVAALDKAFERHEAATLALAGADQDQLHEALRKYFEEDWAFHQVILEHCRNRYIVSAVDALSFRVHRMRQTIGVGKSDSDSALAEHQAILDAVRAGDTGRAVAAMHEHLQQLQMRVGTDD
ncbi:MAG: GntR family transcriptional regulator [Beutenbergiaceae bacterium]